MPRSDPEPEYRRRAREKAEENERRARAERDEVQRESRTEERIASAIKRIEEQFDRAHDKQAPRHKSERRWHIAEALGLWAAAAVGATAIVYGTHDADKQRAVTLSTLKEMQAEQRPWVYPIDVLAVGRIGLVEDKYALPLKFNIVNTGRLPAFFAQPQTAVTPLSVGMSARDVQNEVCDKYRNHPLSESTGATVFAGQTIVHGGFTPEDYPAFSKSKWDSLKGEKLLILVGCIDYQFPDQPGHHQTRFSFAVGKRVDVGALTRIGVLPDDPTALDLHMLPVDIGDRHIPAD